MCVFEHMQVNEGPSFPGPGSEGDCELPDVGSGNQLCSISPAPLYFPYPVPSTSHFSEGC